MHISPVERPPQAGRCNTSRTAADPLTDTFGNLIIVWLIVLNAILFSQLWQNKKPPSEITELERIMPLEVGS